MALCVAEESSGGAWRQRNPALLGWSTALEQAVFEAHTSCSQHYVRDVRRGQRLVLQNWDLRNSFNGGPTSRLVCSM